jgi:hypothetical protein
MRPRRARRNVNWPSLNWLRILATLTRFSVPLHLRPQKAIEGPIHSLDVAAYHARAAVEQINQRARFQNWTVFGLILALGMALGGGAAYFFFARQVAALNDRFDYLQHLLLTPTPAAADTHAPMPQAGKKHGQH